MTTIAEIARFTAPCRHCRSLFHPRAAQVVTGEDLYCPACVHPPCQACHHHRASHPVYGLHLCRACATVAFSSCWRKTRYAADPGTRSYYDDGHPLYGYPCPLCQGWHLTKMPDGGGIPAEYRTRQAHLAALITRLGWRVDAARAAHHTIPMEERS